jgi:hypothetical protein
VSIHLAKLQRIYKESEGIDVVSGMNPFHFNNYRDAAFTHFSKDGQSLTDHLGISLWEAMLLESFCKTIKPSGIYIVGNGLGWSALALALANPDAAVVVIDPDSGVDLVNRIAFRNALRCVAVRGYSPADNEAIIGQYFNKVPDLILIDGLHTNEAIVSDFRSLFSICGPEAVYFFHDVINFDLFAGLKDIASFVRTHHMSTAFLASSPSGMAVVYPNNTPADVQSLISLFGLNPAGVAMVAARTGSTMIQALE